MQFKAAILLVGLVALASAKPAPRGEIASIGNAILAVNQVIRDFLGQASEAVEAIQGDADGIREHAEADAAARIASARQAVADALAAVQGDANEDAGKLVQCVLDQQDDVDAAVQAAADAVIESVTANLDGIGDGLGPLVADLQAQNQALRVVEAQLPACEQQEDPLTCAVEQVGEILLVLSNVPARIEDSLADARAALEAAAQRIGADADEAVEGLRVAGLEILNNVATCAVS